MFYHPVPTNRKIESTPVPLKVVLNSDISLSVAVPWCFANYSNERLLANLEAKWLYKHSQSNMEIRSFVADETWTTAKNWLNLEWNT